MTGFRFILNAMPFCVLAAGLIYFTRYFINWRLEFPGKKEDQDGPTN